MSNLTSVGISSGVPNSGTGTVSTIDNLPNLTLSTKLVDTAGTNKLVIDTHGSSQTTLFNTSGSAVTFNNNGSAVSASSAPVVIASDQTTISVSPDTSKIFNAATGTVLTPQFATIVASSSGATTIIPLVTSKKIRVLQWIVTGNGAVNFKWQSHVTPTDLTGLFYVGAAGGGAGAAYNPLGHFQTNTGEALDINLSGAVAVGGYLVYVTV